MSLWIPVTLAAVVFQTARFMLQKHLAGAGLSAGGATFARFLWSAPLVWLAWGLSGIGLPPLPPLFWLWAMLGGVTQILATVLVVVLFKGRNFAVGVTLKKTEVLLTALLGFVLLGEGVSGPALIAILAGMAGVLVLTNLPEGRTLLARFATREAGIGLASGLFFALSGVSYRAASLAVPGTPGERALLTLLVVVTMQLVVMAVWLRLRERGEISRVVAAWRGTIWVGVTSVAGSFCWFTAFTLQTAALVYAVGQFEVVLSLLASVLFFRETMSRRELWGIGLVTASVVALIWLS